MAESDSKLRQPGFGANIPKPYAIPPVFDLPWMSRRHLKLTISKVIPTCPTRPSFALPLPPHLPSISLSAALSSHTHTEWLHFIPSAAYSAPMLLPPHLPIFFLVSAQMPLPHQMPSLNTSLKQILVLCQHLSYISERLTLSTTDILTSGLGNSLGSGEDEQVLSSFRGLYPLGASRVPLLSLLPTPTPKL